MTIKVSDSAPDSAGRRSSAIQRKFRIPHASRNPTREPKSVSVCSMTTSAPTWGAATASRRQIPMETMPPATAAAEDDEFGGGAMA